MEKVCISQLTQLSASQLRQGRNYEVVERKPFAKNGDGEELIGFFIAPVSPYARDMMRRVIQLNSIYPA